MYYLLQLTGFFLSLSVVHVSRQHISVQKHKLGCRLFFCFNGFCLFLEVLSRFCNWTVHVDHLLEHRSKCNSYEGRRSWSHRAENREGMTPRFTPIQHIRAGEREGWAEGTYGRLSRPRKRWYLEVHDASLMPSTGQRKDMPLIRDTCSEQANWFV
jgi:hypothetical protein